MCHMLFVHCIRLKGAVNCVIYPLQLYDRGRWYWPTDYERVSITEKIEVGGIDLWIRVSITEKIEVGGIDLRVSITEMIEVGGIDQRVAYRVSSTEVTEKELIGLTYDTADEP